jgi:hypothetical protein
MVVQVLKLLRHDMEAVRKKAVGAMHRYEQELIWSLCACVDHALRISMLAETLTAPCAPLLACSSYCVCFMSYILYTSRFAGCS